MSWNLDSDRPIYSQIMEQLKIRIISGFYAPGSKLPSVRELAMEASVNPNTMQKAFSELENTGLIVTMRTSGRFVTEDISMIQNVRTELANEQIQIFLTHMKELGFSIQDILHLLKNKENSGGELYE